MSKNYLLLTRLSYVFAMVASVFVLASCGGKQSGTKGDNEFAVRTLQGSDVELNNSYPAVIKGEQDIDIRPKVSGFITRLCVDEGSVVKKGQLLFKIDDVQYKEVLNQERATVDLSKTAVATAQLTYDNNKKLNEQKIIGSYQLQTSANSLATAKASLAQAKAAYVAAKQNFDYCSVTSPSNGVVGSIPYRVGSLVSASSAEALTTVSNIKKMYVYFSMPEQQLLVLTRQANNDKANAALSTFPPVKLQLVDGSMYGQTGKVATVSGVIDQKTGSISVRADFDNPAYLLKSGGSGIILIPYVAKDAILIPQNSTVEVQDQKYIYLVGSDNKVKYTNITVADVDDGQNYIVTSGLKAGDRIVVEGVSKLSDGMSITPITEAKATAKIKQAQQMGAALGKK